MLLLLFEIRSNNGKLEFVACGLNIVPLTMSNEYLMNGVFEIPFVQIDLDPEVFSELNQINPWQF